MFRYNTILLAAVSLCAASPIKRAVISQNDSDVLNFALGLEHLENAYYHLGLQMYDEAAFEAAGLPKFARGRMADIAFNEQTHVQFLQSALGENATKPCSYNFPLDPKDPKSFVTLSMALEGVGAAAYSGAANLLTDKGLIKQSATILSTEARQAAFVASSLLQLNPWSTAFETPLNMRQAISLASGFIVPGSCPATNPNNSLTPFPALNVVGQATFVAGQAGQTISLSFNLTASGTSSSTPLFLALLTGLNNTFVPINGTSTNGSTTAILPANMQGTVYALVSTSHETVSDDTTVAGMAILQFPYNSAFNVTQ